MRTNLRRKAHDFYDQEFVFFSGKIVMHYDPWWCIWVFWQPKLLPSPKCCMSPVRQVSLSGFVDRNRGRHWDRK